MLPQSPIIPPQPLLAAAACPDRGLAQAPGPACPTGVRGFIDIHCHVAPGLDDGPTTIQGSIAMVRSAYRSGTLAMVATPHRSLRYLWREENLARGLAQFEDRVPADFAVFAGCELELSHEAWRGFEGDPRRYCLNRSRYVLVELPAAVSARCFTAVLERLRGAGFVPILAHAERCRPPWVAVDQLARWVDEGCLLQLTADAISGRRGPCVRAAARELLRAGLAHFVASDAHDVVRRPPNLQPAYRAVSEMAGLEQAARLFTYNPLRVLRDEPIAA